ncbi:MAG TPA: glycoside hydrolase family 2 protein [Acidobacteriaceae bacterium]|nr:glycoside hydrolase family 2 protein [Acidobacteriaceae bacterium]
MRSLLALLLLALPVLSASARSQARPARESDRDMILNSGWEFRSLNAAEHPETQTWHPASVPGVVPLDLLASRLIPDPFYRDNEKSLQWIGLTDWEYRKTLTLSPAQLTHHHVELVFDGLDTFADVYVNDKPLLQANNMFRTWRADAKPLLRAGDNQLRVVFHSAITTMMPRVKAMPIRLPTVGQVQIVSEEGIATDPYVRKAPYSYGWDWGPRFVNEGIWKNVHLVTWDNVRLGRLHIAQKDISSAVARVEAQLDVIADREMTVQLSLTAKTAPSAHNSAAMQTSTTTTEDPIHLVRGANHVSIPLEIDHPSLWYPLGYGAQSRYDFAVTLAAANLHESSTVRTGLRSVELRRDPDDIGTSFYFVVNGKPVFAKGADVIPFDSFAPRVTPAQHRRILQSAAEAHMNMIRAWGGGYYESDDFYDICDELGILVWQEFMFGGAQVPGDTDVPGFRENVRQEAVDQVDRLRDHPSIALWCGNNEVETGWYHWGDRINFKKSLTANQQEKVWQDYLLVMNDVLKSVVAERSPETPYTPSSPHAGYEHIPDIQTAGDMHYWSVWGQSSTPISEYNNITPRFMSEYGFQSFPEMRTIASFAQPTDEQLDSPIMLAHQKNTGGNERIKRYMEAEYPAPKDFASFVYLSQVQQAEAIRVAAEHLRSSRPRTMGSLYWQLNDCWPGPSWASIDYYGRWKALQFYAKKFYADVTVAPYLHDGVIDTTIISDLDHSVSATLTVTTMSFSGSIYSTSTQTYTVRAASAKRVSHLDVSSLLGQHSSDDSLARFVLSVSGTPIAERQIYFDHVKNLALPLPQIQPIWSVTGGKTRLTLRSASLARNVWISFGDHDLQLSDNSFDLLPGIPVTVEVDGKLPLEELKRSLQIMSLRDAFADTTASAASAAQGQESVY